ncbi:MAG: alpha/beta hydrolase [Desulfarculaceae bacterium]|jgi:alpha-beta hydrolase superfamily lysophospholipase
MEARQQLVSIPYPSGDLAAATYYPAGPPQGAVVIAHGLQSSKASTKLTRLSQSLAAAGLAALRFDHSGCGQSPGDMEETTLSSRRDEFLAAMEFLASQVPGLPLVYMGSSLGGTTALLAGDIKPPACTVCWSTPTDLEALYLRLRDQAGEPGMRALARDMPAHDLSAVLARTSRVLFVHGERDEVVPAAQARRGHRLARAPKELMIIPQADHRLSKEQDQLQAMAQTLAWIEPFIKSGNR